MYGEATDDKIYKLPEKWGICYELVGQKGAVKLMVDNYEPNDEIGKENCQNLLYGEWYLVDMKEI